MKTQDFIRTQKERIDRGEHLTNGTKHCASVMATDDRIYSYGYHYPLLFQIETNNGKLWVCNNGGYSATTSKHISYSQYLADICVPIGGTDGRTITKEDVINAIQERLQLLTDSMRGKLRKNTKVFGALESEHKRYTEYLQKATQ